MTIGEFSKLIKDNNIPEDVTMLSDSGWECGASEMDGVYYNEEGKEIVFTQEGDKYDHYYDKKSWRLINSKSYRNEGKAYILYNISTNDKGLAVASDDESANKLFFDYDFVMEDDEE